MKRDVQLDLIRAVSMFFVIAVHALPHVFFPRILESALSLIFYSANGMFFMISGYFNLRNTFENINDYKKFFFKKLVTIIIPFIVISFCIFLSSNRNNISLATPSNFCHSFLTNDIYYHLWFMYLLIGFIVATPFISKMVKNMSETDTKIFLIIAIIWNCISVILCSDILSIEFGFSGWLFSDYLFYYVAGYLLDKIKIKNYNLMYLISGFFLVISTVQLYLFPEKLIYNLSPFHSFVIVSIYIFLKDKCLIKNEYIKNLLKIISSYSFIIYLVHAKVLDVVDYYFPQPNINILKYIYLIICTFFISLIHSLILNKLIFNPLKKLLLKSI